MVFIPVIKEMRVAPNGSLIPFVETPDGKLAEVAHGVMPGAQAAFLSCPLFEVLAYGNRGASKSHGLMYDFLLQVGLGYGSNYRGVLFRKSTRQFDDLERIGKSIYFSLVPGTTYDAQMKIFKFPQGEQLKLTYLERPESFDAVLGQSIQWCGIDELSGYDNPIGEQLYRDATSLLRTSVPAIKLHMRATMNPTADGWIKDYFQCPVPKGKTVGTIIEGKRVAILHRLSENQALAIGTPDYKKNMENAAGEDEFKRKSWVDENSDWTNPVGGLFSSTWHRVRGHAVVPEIFFRNCPRDIIKLSFSFDYGTMSPFSAGWYATFKSNYLMPFPDGRQQQFIRNDVVRFYEWWGGTERSPDKGIDISPRTMAQGILQRELSLGIKGKVGERVADNQIFNTQRERDDRLSIEQIFEQEGFAALSAAKGKSRTTKERRASTLSDS